jgi:hypothetical protein
MPFRPVALPAALLCSTTLALLLPAAPASAQERRRTLPTDGEAAFTREYQRHRVKFNTINKANDGEKANKDSKEDQAAIDVSAQWYTYRLTWDPTPGAGHINTLMEEFFGQVNNADSPAMRKGNPAFAELYLKALAVRARDVIQTGNSIAAVNAARMLARLTRAGSDEAADACLDAVKDANGFLDPKARLGVQYWAFQGLGTALQRLGEAPPPAEGAPPAAAVAARKEREKNIVQALVQAIERKPTANPAPPGPDEVRGLQIYRREAVRALSQYRSPAVTDEKGVVKVPSALTLLKVVNDDGMSPPAALDEEIEAAAGVASLLSKAVPSYQPAYAAQQLGYLVVEVARNAQAGDKFPWKVYAARLADALEAMRADVKGNPDKAAADYVAKMVDLAARVLKDIETSSKGNGSDLKFWLVNTPVPQKMLFAGLPDSTVHPLEKSEAPPEKPAEKPGDKKPTDKPGDKKPGDKPGDKKPGDKPGKP